MPSPRPLRSGLDFQLRYAALRAVALACGADPLSERAAAVRVEWPVSHAGGDAWVDVVIEDASGRVLEIVECREHAGHLPDGSIVSFLTNVRELRAAAAAERYRYVSTARFLGDGTDFADAAGRRRVLKRLGFEDSDDTLWELGVDSRSALAAYTVVLLTDRVKDAKRIYTHLYARIAGQMAHRHPGEGERFLTAIRDVHLELLREIERETFTRDASVEPEDAFALADLRRLLHSPQRRAVVLSAEKVQNALRRAMPDSKVALPDIFIEPGGMYEVPANDRTLLYPGTALASLFDWLADVRDGQTRRGPLLVIGGFGSGKSSLLTMFAARLLEARSSVVPILVPLRDLVAAGMQTSFSNVLRDYIKREWRVDVLNTDEEDDVRYCVLCDGFDELNLYFSAHDQRRWVEQVYRELTELSQYRHLAVAISSRPILLLDVSRQEFPGARAPRLTIHDFTPEQVGEWCARYRSASGMTAELDAEFLATRNLLEVCRTPIVLYMLARIVEDDPAMLAQERYNQADVYRIFVDWTAKKGGYERDAIKHRVPAGYRGILQDAAWHLSQTDGGFMDEQELLSLLRGTYGHTVDEIPVDRNLLVAHMFQPAGRLGESRLIEFRHQSFRDYLVAERIWRLCGDARRGEPLTPGAWFALRGKPVTSATIQFIAEIAQSAPAEELRALYRALERTDQVHAYWSMWSAPVWERLAAEGNDAEAIARARSHMDTLAPRACTQATLGFLLKVKIYAVLAAREATEELPPPSAEALTRLLGLQDVFPETGLAAQSRSLLLRNLDGLRLDELGIIERAALSHALLRGAELMAVSFLGTGLRGVALAGARLRRCTFRRGELDILDAPDLHLIACVFDVGVVTLGGQARPLERVRIEGCTFEAVTLSLFLTEAKISGCGWIDVRLQQTILVRCELDAEAHAFLSENGATLVDCRVTGTRTWLRRSAFKDLAASLRECEGRQFERAALPFLRLLYGDVRQAAAMQELDRAGIDLHSGRDDDRFDLVVQCKSSVTRDALPRHLDECRASIARFAASGFRTHTYILLFNREADTVAYRESLLSALQTLAQSGAAKHVLLWNHHDLLNEAFNAMFARVVRSIRDWNDRMLLEQRHIEEAIGGVPVDEVPFAVHALRVDAARLLTEEPVLHITDDPLNGLLDGQRRIRVLLGEAGMGKTTAAMRAMRRMPAQWLYIPGSSIRGDVANAHSLFEKALDEEAVLAGAADEDRPVWQRMIGPILKYLTQWNSGFGIVVDGLDEAPALETSYGLQRFFSLFRRAVVPIVVTARTEFWRTRRADFELEIRDHTPRESTVQTISVTELEPWTDELIASAATRFRETVDDPDALQRVNTFLATVCSGTYADLYGDIPRTPLFLRFLLDLLAAEDPRHLGRATVVLRWARLKVLRDFQGPMRHGGRRIPIREEIRTADENVAASFRAMEAAAACMSAIADGEVRLLPDCDFEQLRARMGADAPDSAAALVLNSLVVPAGSPSIDGAQRIRFAHRIFQERFLARWIAAHPADYTNAIVPSTIAQWNLDVPV